MKITIDGNNNLPEYYVGFKICYTLSCFNILLNYFKIIIRSKRGNKHNIVLIIELLYFQFTIKILTIQEIKK